MEETASTFNSSGNADVECDVCIGWKRKAEQACLECVSSYCDIHLDLHNTLHGGKRHRLVEANEGLQGQICPDHDRLKEVYCRTDNQCICYLCITDKHRAHDVITLEDEVTNKQLKLAELQSQTTDIIEAKENDVLQLRQAVQVFRTSAQKALEENERSFTELMQSIRDSQNSVSTLILDQTEAAERQAEEFLETLQQEINNLKDIDAKLQDLRLLSRSNNNVRFLESAAHMPSPTAYKKSFVLFEHPHCSFDRATEAVTALKQQLYIYSKWSLLTSSGRVKNTRIVTSSPPQTREEFLQYASKLTFNTNTAHQSLQLSDEDRKVTASHYNKDYPEHKERFDNRAQILCNQALRGARHYWEVKFGGGCWVCMAVSYDDICRKGKRGPLFGRNKYSWGLRCFGSSSEFWHNNKQTTISGHSFCYRMGVYLDHGAGIIAFYNVTDKMSLIYKAQTVFSKPVFPGFGMGGKGSYVRFCEGEELDSKKPLFALSMCQFKL